MPSPAPPITSRLLRHATIDLPPITSEVSAILPTSGRAAYDVLTDIASIPRWLTVVHSARVLEVDADGRPARAAFVARLQRASLGYTLRYQHAAEELAVDWSTDPESSVRIAGSASLVPLALGSCLLRYQLAVELPVDAAWEELGFARNPAAAVVSALHAHIRAGAG